MDKFGKFGIISIAMFMISLISFFTLRGPNANLTGMIILLGSLSLLGIIFAVISKKVLPIIFGVLTNGLVLVFSFFLLVAKGIGG